MSSSARNSVAALLDEASRAFEAVQTLDKKDAEQIVDKLERLQSQLMEATPPPSLVEAEARLGLTPATPEEFAELAKHMQPPDGEG